MDLGVNDGRGQIDMMGLQQYQSLQFSSTLKVKQILYTNYEGHSLNLAIKMLVIKLCAWKRILIQPKLFQQLSHWILNILERQRFHWYVDAFVTLL